MESEIEEVDRSVEVVSGKDLEEFAVKLDEAIATWSNPGGQPRPFVPRHTATPSGFNYVGIFRGNGPRAREAEMRFQDDKDRAG